MDSTSDLNFHDTFESFLTTYMHSSRPTVTSRYESVCNELGIVIPISDTAAETAAALMPAGGPACDQIPSEWTNVINWALAWARATARYPPAWLGKTTNWMKVISIFCGAFPPSDTKEFWTRAVPALRERFCHANPTLQRFTPPTGFTRKDGDTLMTSCAPDNTTCGTEFQLLCDEEGIILPFHENEILEAAALIDARWTLDFQWGREIGPRELVAIHAWFEEGRAFPDSDQRWHVLPKFLIHRAEIAHHIGAGSSIDNRNTPLTHIRALRRKSAAIPGGSGATARELAMELGGFTGEDAIASWLTYGTGYMKNPGTPFFIMLTERRTITPPDGRDIIQALVDLSPNQGLAPAQIPPRLHAAAACALTWAFHFAPDPAAWQCLPRESEHFLLALSGTRPQSSQGARRHALEDLRAEFNRARLTWLDLPDPRPSYPRLNARPPTYDISLWIESGAVPLHGSYWFVTDHATSTSSRQITQERACIELAPLAILSGTPPDFIPPRFAREALIALRWAHDAIRSLRLRSLAPPQRAFLLGICGIFPEGSASDKLRQLEARIAMANQAGALSAKELADLMCPNPSSYPGFPHPCALGSASGPTSSVSVFQDIPRVPAHKPGWLPLPFLRNGPAPPAPAAGAASSPGGAHSLPVLHTTPRATFFDDLLRMANRPRPLHRIAARALLDQLPFALSRAADAVFSDHELLEHTSALIFGYLIGPHQPGGDSLWEKVPQRQLTFILSWLHGSEPMDTLTHHQLGEAASQAIHQCMATPGVQGAILKVTTPREDFALFHAPPDPSSDPDECQETFTLACILQGLPIPGSEADCNRLLARLGILATSLDVHPASARSREAAAAAIWAGNICKSNPGGPIAVSFSPTPRVFDTLTRLFPCSSPSVVPTWQALLVRIARAWGKVQHNLSSEASRTLPRASGGSSPLPEPTPPSAGKHSPSSSHHPTSGKRGRSGASAAPINPARRSSALEILSTEQLAAELAVARASGVENLTVILNLQAQLRAEKEANLAHQQAASEATAQSTLAAARYREQIAQLQSDCARLTEGERSQRTLKELHIGKVHELTSQLEASRAAAQHAQTALQTAARDFQFARAELASLQADAAADRASATAAQAEAARLQGVIDDLEDPPHPGARGRDSPRSDNSLPLGSPHSSASFSRSSSISQSNPRDSSWSPSRDSTT